MRYLFLITATTVTLGAATFPATAHWLDWFDELRGSFTQIGGGDGGGSAVINTSTNVIDCGNNNNNSPQQAACD